MRVRRRRILALLLALVAVMCSGGCATRDVYVVRESRALRESDPAPFRVAVSSAVALDRTVAAMSGKGSLPLSFSIDDLSSELTANLEAMNAATSVFVVDGEMALDEADEQNADLLVKPRLTEFDFGHVQAADAAWLGGLLWITTWFGGLLVEDSVYDARMRVEWDLFNPHTAQRIATLSTASDDVRLSFLDRNRFFSLGTLESLLVPPVFTIDDVTTTSDSLTRRAVTHVAAQLARYLKDDLGGDERELLGQCRISSPRNGSVVGRSVRLRGAIVGRDLITEVAIFVNEESHPLLHLDSRTLPPRSAQQIGSLYEVMLPDRSIDLRDGTNHIVIEYVVSGRRTSRTLRLIAGEGETS